jgi:hypothetical protein
MKFRSFISFFFWWPRVEAASPAVAAVFRFAGESSIPAAKWWLAFEWRAADRLPPPMHAANSR